MNYCLFVGVHCRKPEDIDAEPVPCLRCPSSAPRDLHSSSLDEPAVSSSSDRQSTLLRGSSFDSHESMTSLGGPAPKMRNLNLDGSLIFSPRLKSHTSAFQSHDGGVASVSIIDGIPITGNKYQGNAPRAARFTCILYLHVSCVQCASGLNVWFSINSDQKFGNHIDLVNCHNSYATCVFLRACVNVLVIECKRVMFLTRTAAPCIMTLHHDLASWPCIMTLHHDLASWPCIMTLHCDRHVCREFVWRTTEMAWNKKRSYWYDFLVNKMSRSRHSLSAHVDVDMCWLHDIMEYVDSVMCHVPCRFKIQKRMVTCIYVHACARMCMCVLLSFLCPEMLNPILT